MSTSVGGLDRAPAVVRDVGAAVLRSYAQVIFSRSPTVGLWLLLATLTVPNVGLVGLFGVLASLALSTALRLDPEAVRSGALGYNALLVFLGIGATLTLSPAFWVLALVLVGVVVLVHVAMTASLARHFNLPALSLPFVVVSWMAFAAVPHIRGMGVRGTPPALTSAAFPGPEVVDTLLRSLGAIFFQPHWVAGALVLVGLAVYSRIAVVYALLGFAAAMAADAWLFSFPPDFVHLYIGFNVLMTAIALGGIFYVPSPGSLATAIGGVLGCGLVSVALVSVLAPVGLPVLALPFNLTVLLTLYALGQRTGDVLPRPVDAVGRSPEAALEHYRTRVARFQGVLPVPLMLPVRAPSTPTHTWVCTQGNDGEHTHQGPWRHGIDLELCDAAGRTFVGEGQHSADYLGYRQQVVAPAAGTVVQVIDGLADQAPGQFDLANRWGNALVLQHGPTQYTVLAHLSPGSLTVVAGQHVVAGQALARLGSSGRSPVPHLHIQAQRSPELGAPTCPIAFADTVVLGKEPVLAAFFTPDKGDRIRPVSADPGLAAKLTFAPGSRHTMQSRDTLAGPWRDEVLVSEMDLLGQRSLVSEQTQARLWFTLVAGRFTVLDYQGPTHGTLFAWSLALRRIPFDAADGLSWTDHLDPRRHAPSRFAWWLDGIAWLLPPRTQRIRFAARGSHNGLRVVRGEADAADEQATIDTEACWFDGDTLPHVRVRLGGRYLAAQPASDRPVASAAHPPPPLTARTEPA